MLACLWMWGRNLVLSDEDILQPEEHQANHMGPLDQAQCGVAGTGVSGELEFSGFNP